MKKVSAIIVAAGAGTRFGAAKQFVPLKGKPLVEWSLARFEEHGMVDEIVLVLPEKGPEGAYASRYGKIRAVVEGGARRQDSVFAGFRTVSPDETEIVLVHDAARPLFSADLISRIIKATLARGSAVPALTVEDTVKEVEEGEVVRTLNREKLVRVQTPQGFLYRILKEALARAREEGFYGTDEAMLVERAGKRVAVISGDPWNIKITSPSDMKIAEALLGA
jgi:2-C-methyl-D-erythritol 4-phosphate cytidylyltransferase